MSITITSIKNPFEPEFNEIQVVDFVSGQTLGEYLPNLPIKDGIDFVFAVNGKEVDSDFVLSDGDLVAVCAKVEWSAATWVGSLAASAFNTGWAATAVYYGVSAVAFLAIGYGASVLVSALGPDTPELEDKGATNFGWETPKLSHFEGEPIPLIFGKVRTAGQIIQQFTSTYNGDNAEFENKEYLNLLVGVCNHEVDSITNMKINDQPVDSFTEVETHFRLGSINNTPIPGFGEIRHQNIVNIMQTTTAITRTTEGDAVQKILVDLVFPNGMYYIRGNGKLGTLGASYWVQYRRVFNDGTFGEWIEPYEGYPDALGSPDDPNLKAAVFVASTQDPIRRTIVIDNLEPGKYEISSARVDDDDHQLSAQDDSYWDSFTEIIKEELSYPGMSLYSLSAMATDQLSGGMPNITVEVERKTVDVYDSNFGQWTKKPASNPAWICYALLNTYAGVPESRILYNEFGDWATYCDELVDGQCRFSCNTIVDGGNFWDNIQKIARIGRASVMHRGSKYGVFVDRSESVVSHMFTMGNILDGTFNLQYLPQIDRANYIELEYTDPDKEYSRQIVGLYDQAYLGENEQQPAKVSFEAAIPREQVIREGIFRINSNKHLNRVISFEAGVYSFACRVGDLFYFQHEIVDYESANTGGRIVSADTSSVVIDQTVTIQTGVVYKLLVEFMDGSFVERTVTSLAGTTDTLTVSQPWGTLPEQHCQYLFGEAETYKKAYRLTSCEFRDDYTRSIVGIEYIEDIYTDDSAIIEDLDRPGSIDIARAVNVKAHEALVYSSDGSLKSIIKLSWTPLHSNLDTKWQIWMYDMTTGGPLFLLADNVRGVTYSIESINLLMDHEYKIAVINQGQAVEDSGVNTTFVTIMGKLAPPADVEIFVALWMSVQQQVRFSWSEIEDVDLKKYEIREGATWDTGIKIAESPSLSVAVDIESGVAETRTYFIKALDTSGIYSRVEKSTTVEIDSTGANILETIDLIQSDVDEALGYLDDWASDEVLSAVEKKSLRSGWEIRCAEYIEIKSRATDLGLTTQAFSLQTAFGAWGTYLNGGVSWTPPTTTPITDDMMPLWINNANLSIDQIVVRSDFNEEATTYFDVLVTAKMDIAEEINTNIAAAVNDASIAKGHIDDWSSDGIFSSVEKKSFRSGWEIRCAEYLDLKAQATTLFLSAQVSVFETAFSAWGTYLNGGVSWAPPTTTPITDAMMPLWINNANLSIDQIIVRSDFNDNAANYFTALIAIKTAISTTVNNNISTAKDGAATALTHLQDWASDGIFSSVEKKSFRSGWEIRCAEYIDIKAQATSLGLTTQVNSLETAFGTWGKYINAGSNWTLPTTTPITDAMMPSWIKDTNLSTDQAITRSAFNDNASQYFDTLVLVKTAIANKLNSNTVNAGTTANWPTVDNKPTSIGEINAQELADIQAAKTDASTALEYLDDWAEDNKLTPVEKKALRSGMEIRFAEYLEIKAQATSLGLTSQATSLQTALNVWGKYLNNGATWTAPTAMPITNAMMPSWIKDANLSTMQTISRSAFNSAATTYFDALISVKTAITNKINSNITGAGTTANWSNIADDDGNRPADGADKTSSVLSPSSLAWKTTVSYAMLDETLIVGGFLKTSLIDVDNLKVKGSLIVGDIDYSKIDGGPPANADVTDYDAIYADTQDRIDALDLSNLEEDLIYSCIDFINLTAFGNSETADTWEFDSQFTGGAIIQIEIPDSFQGRIEASFNGTQLTTDLHESGQLGDEVVDILDLNRDGETIDLGSIS